MYSVRVGMRRSVETYPRYLSWSLEIIVREIMMQFQGFTIVIRTMGVGKSFNGESGCLLSERGILLAYFLLGIPSRRQREIFKEHTDSKQLNDSNFNAFLLQ